ncbi:hypothetical protein K503DRAFT_806412, partial [Rhizopogon vinicolor AM-OR11-026]
MFQPPSVQQLDDTGQCSATLSWDAPEPPNVRNTAAANALAREDEDDSTWRLGRRKRARMLTTDPASHRNNPRLPSDDIHPLDEQPPFSDEQMPPPDGLPFAMQPPDDPPLPDELPPFQEQQMLPPDSSAPPDEQHPFPDGPMPLPH